MAQQFLDRADVIVAFQQVGGKGVAEGMAGDALVDPGQAGRLPDGLLQPALVQVMAAHDVAAGVHRQPLRRKDVLPGPLLVGVGVFALQGLGQVDCAAVPGQVVLVQPFHVLEMLLEWRDEAVGQQRYPVLRREPDPEVFWGVVPS